MRFDLSPQITDENFYLPYIFHLQRKKYWCYLSFEEVKKIQSFDFRPVQKFTGFH